MYTLEQILAAIADLRARLPELLGAERWPAFEQQLASYLADLSTARQHPTNIKLLLLQLFMTAPAAHAALLAIIDPARLAQETTRRAHEPTTKDATPTESPNLAISNLQSPPTTRYTDIACPRRVWIGAERLAVVVRLTVAPPTRSAALQPLSVRADAPVDIHLTAPAFDLLNAADQPAPILPDADSPPVVFDLKPRVVGPTRLVFDFRQAGNPVGTAVAPIEITPDAVVEAPEVHTGTRLTFPHGIDAPDLVLYVTYDASGAQATLALRLEEAGRGVTTFEAVPLTGDIAGYTRTLYRDLSTWAEQAGVAVNDAAFLVELNDQLQQLGHQLWHSLTPGAFKELYAARRAAWQDKTLLIVSDEPHIPWEVLWPYDPRTKSSDPAPWAVTLRLTRWLRRDAVSTGYSGPPGAITLHRLACIAPTNTGLTFLADERAFVHSLVAAPAIEDVGPANAKRRTVLAFLRSGGYDWLHIASHGVDPDDADAPGSIVLEDGYLRPTDLIGPQVEGHLYAVRPGVVLNLCHGGRLRWGVTQLDGWAHLLVGAGAGLVVAPLWSVTDTQALLFTQTFYAWLLEGAPLAAAVAAARHAAYAAGDPTWLAYSVYAHPHAQIGRQ